MHWEELLEMVRVEDGERSWLGMFDELPPMDTEGDGEGTLMPSLLDAYFADLFILALTVYTAT